MRWKKILVLAVFVMFGMLRQQLQAQTLTFHIPNLPDTTVHLVRYYGPGLYFADTTRSVNGLVVFNGAKHAGGMYAVLLPGQTYFEFIHDKEPVEMTVTSVTDPMGSVTVNSSQNNVIFYEYVRFMNENKGRMAELNKQYNALPEGNPQRDSLSAEMKALNEKIATYQRGLLAKYGGSLFVADLIEMTVEMKLPDFPKDENGTITDSAFVYNYYIAHYWDGIDLSDPRIVNSPVFHNKLDAYFSPRGLMQHPDTIIKYSYWLLEKMNQTDQTNKVFQYSLHHIIYKYDTMQVMGMDKVFWFLSENYYCPPNNKAYWVTEEGLKKICDANEKVGRILIGNYAIPLILTDTTEKKWINFYDIVADYTILYFWDPTCGHCKTETPLLQMLYEKKFKQRNIEIYAVAQATGGDFALWKKFIVDHKLTFTNVGLTANIYNEAMKDPSALLQHTTLESLNYATTYDVFTTPRIFLLDKDKRILYKEINLYQLEYVLDQLTGHAADEKLIKK